MEISSTKEIIKAVKNDERGIAKMLYLRYREPFFTWARPRYRCNDADLADAFQEAVIVFYQNIQEGKLVELKASVKTYLFSVGKNLLLKRYEKQKRIISADAPDAPDFSGIDISIETSENLSHRQRILQEAFARMGENCRSILTYFYYRNFDNEEIARRMNYKNTDTVKSRKRNCMVKLEKILREDFAEDLY